MYPCRRLHQLPSENQDCWTFGHSQTQMTVLQQAVRQVYLISDTTCCRTNIQRSALGSPSATPPVPVARTLPAHPCGDDAPLCLRYMRLLSRGKQTMKILCHFQTTNHLLQIPAFQHISNNTPLPARPCGTDDAPYCLRYMHGTAEQGKQTTKILPQCATSKNPPVTNSCNPNLPVLTCRPHVQ